MANEALSQGAILRVETATAGTYVVVGGVQGIQVPGRARDDIEVTALDSTAREYIADLPDTGETSFTIFIRKGTTAPAYEAGQERLEVLSASGAIVNFQVVLPPSVLGSITYTCAGYVKNFQVQVETRAAVTAACTIRWTGAVVKA